MGLLQPLGYSPAFDGPSEPDRHGDAAKCSFQRARDRELIDEGARPRVNPPATRTPYPTTQPFYVYVTTAAVARKRKIARNKNKLPMPATRRNWGQTTSISAPR